MSNLAELIASSADVAGPCRFGKILNHLDADDRAAVVDALEQPGFSDERLAHILDRGGHPVSASTIRRHRHRRCNCPTTTTEAAA